MPSSWTHAMAAVAVASALVPRRTPPRVWAMVAVAAVLPDVDAIGRPFGVGDLEFLGGHRALTHSVTTAAGMATVAAAFAFRGMPRLTERAWLWGALALAITTHGLLDTLVTYGEGVQLLAPWSTRRFASAWPFLGGGIVRDTAFIVCFGVARLLMHHRGLAVPRWLDLGPKARVPATSRRTTIATNERQANSGRTADGN